MSLFSLFRKNKPDSDSDDNAYRARTEIASDSQRSRRRKSGSADAGPASREGGSPIDPVLPEKKRARRRLVGAVALVLAVIIGVPMVLDSEPKPLADDLTIEIPSKSQSAPPATPPVTKKPDATPAPSVSSTASLSQKEEMIDPGAKPETKNNPPAESVAMPAGDNLSLEPPGAKKQEPKSAHLPAVPETRPVPVASVAKKKSDTLPSGRLPNGTDEARAKAILEDAAVPSPKPGKFNVQVAALASADKVNELQERLKNAGIASYTEKIHTDSGERIRIRIGPLGSREDAEKQRIRLSALGLTGTVVPSAP